ncbi:MAG: AAA family ATPase [Thermoanaerobaculia bacterium]|nr:AAA family ATPase [Thermoanaerobaculia bacterium]
MKRFLALVGPKGSGKSTIGRLLEAELGIHFFRVEPLFLEVRERMGASHPDYERTGFELTVQRLVDALAAHDAVSFESTGASSWFEWQLAHLREVARVELVRVVVGPEQCLERIRGRDASLHIPVSDDRIAEINAIAARVVLPWSAEIDNRGDLDSARIVEVVRQLLEHA